MARAPAKVEAEQRAKEALDRAADAGSVEQGAEMLIEGAYEIRPHTIRRGRKSKYKPEYVAQAAKLCKLGATDVELADFFGVCVRTIAYWSVAHEKFLQALKLGKEEADARVERSLFQRAVGYEVEAVKITAPQIGPPKVVKYRECVAPDVTAAIFWLKNRQRDKWRDRQEHEHSGEVSANLVWAQLAQRGKEKALAIAAPSEAAA